MSIPDVGFGRICYSQFFHECYAKIAPGKMLLEDFPTCEGSEIAFFTMNG